jgi:hypothetical protein
VVARDGSDAVVEVLDGGVAVAAWRLAVAAQPDLGIVDDLARLQLAARRFGWSIRLRDPGEGLVALLALAGLTDVLPVDPGRQAERREQRRVEEVVQPDDPVA